MLRGLSFTLGDLISNPHRHHAGRQQLDWRGIDDRDVPSANFRPLRDRNLPVTAVFAERVIASLKIMAAAGSVSEAQT